MGFKSLKKKSKRDKEFSDISQLSNSDEITDTLNKNFYSRNSNKHYNMNDFVRDYSLEKIRYSDKNLLKFEKLLPKEPCNLQEYQIHFSLMKT